MTIMNKKYLELQERIARQFGAKPTEAKILATIKAHHQAVALEEIAEETGYSLATISNTIRFFETKNMVKRIKKPKSKKVYVEARTDYLAVMKQKLEMIYNNTTIVKEQLPQIIKQTRSETEKKYLQEELKQAKQANKIIERTLEQIKQQ